MNKLLVILGIAGIVAGMIFYSVINLGFLNNNVGENELQGNTVVSNEVISRSIVKSPSTGDSWESVEEFRFRNTGGIDG